MITAIDWDYVFFDANNQNELGRRQFRSEEKIGPGKAKNRKYLMTAPPTKTVSIHSLDKNERVNLGGAVVVLRIEYSVGSVWQLRDRL